MRSQAHRDEEEEDAEDTDAEYAERLAKLRLKLGQEPAHSGLGARQALPRLWTEALAPMRARAATREPFVAPGLALGIKRLPKVVTASTEIRLLHALLGRAQLLTGGSPFQRDMARAAARPPWPPLAAPQPGLALAHMMAHWEAALGASVVLVYAYPAQAALALVLEWQTDEVTSSEAVGLVVLCRQTAPAAASAGGSQIYQRTELQDVDVRFPLGTGTAAPEDHAVDRGATHVWRTPVFYESCGLVPAVFAFVAI